MTILMSVGPSLSYSQNFQLTSKWGPSGTDNGLFDQPSGIDMSGNGTEFFVIDRKIIEYKFFNLMGPL